MNRPSATFLFCVESGYFEKQTPLVIESLRKFGGRWADAPVLVVTPRLGPPLTRETMRRFSALGVKYVRKNFFHRYDWYPYTNKALAALMAEEHADTEQIVWLDSDVLVVQPPDELELGPTEDFAVCAYDKNVGSSGPDDPNEAYWHALGEAYGIPVERLPWIETAYDRQRVRFRLHSGVYAYRRGRGLGRAFVEDIERMFASRVTYSRNLPFPGDDVALAYSVVRLGLKWRLLPMMCNFEVGPQAASYSRALLSNGKILHFHHALSRPEGASWMLRELESELPVVASWLRDKVPVDRRAGGMGSLVARRALFEWRKWLSRRYAATCRPMVAS